MARLTTAEINNRLQAAKAEGREPMANRKSEMKQPAHVSRANAILERRAKGF